LVPDTGKTWEERRTRSQEVEQELRRKCREIYAPKASEDGPVARKHFRVWDGPKRKPPQGHIGPRLKNKDGSPSARYQAQYEDKEATQTKVDEYNDTRITLCPRLGFFDTKTRFSV
jgi:hypothetical protein